MHVAAQYGQTALLYYLALRWEMDIEGLDNDGRSCLHWAAYKGFTDTIRLLLVLNSQTDLTDKEGCTALHWAAIRGNGEACTLLIQVNFPLVTYFPQSDSPFQIHESFTSRNWSRICHLGFSFVAWRVWYMIFCQSSIFSYCIWFSCVDYFTQYWTAIPLSNQLKWPQRFLICNCRY